MTHKLISDYETREKIFNIDLNIIFIAKKLVENNPNDDFYEKSYNHFVESFVKQWC